jgi:hypothetical protein
LQALFLNTFEKKEGFRSGSVPLTNGFGSGRPKNIRIRFRIRISNTGKKITNKKKNKLTLAFLLAMGSTGTGLPDFLAITAAWNRKGTRR